MTVALNKPLVSRLSVPVGPFALTCLCVGPEHFTSGLEHCALDIAPYVPSSERCRTIDSTMSSLRNCRACRQHEWQHTINSTVLSPRLLGFSAAGVTCFCASARSRSSKSSFFIGACAACTCCACCALTSIQYLMVSSLRIHKSTSSSQMDAHIDSETDEYVERPRSVAVDDENDLVCCISREGGVDVPQSRECANARLRRSVTLSSTARNCRSISGRQASRLTFKLDQGQAQRWSHISHRRWRRYGSLLHGWLLIDRRAGPCAHRGRPIHCRGHELKQRGASAVQGFYT